MIKKVSSVPYLDLSRQNLKLKKWFRSDFEKSLKASSFILGEDVEKFENAFSSYLGSRFTVGVANGTDAIELAIRALGIGPGDEVIVPTNSFIASALGVTRAGAKAVFCDSDANFHIDLESAERVNGENTKAIVVVSLYGQLPNMDRVLAFAKRYGLRVVEDFAQSQGATYNSRLAGTFGDIGCTSFYPGKNLGALGDAGAVVTNSEELYNRVIALRTYGSSLKYHHPTVGFNSRLDAIQAKFLIRKLELLDSWNKERAKIAKYYSDNLSGIDGLLLPQTIHGANHVWHIYAIRTTLRDSLREYLEERGVSTLIHYPIPIHKQGAYAGSSFDEQIVEANRQGESLLSLPLFPGMLANEVAYVVDQVGSFFNRSV
jgi:dTDP-4-amino-4,6-dideoxygalactose transaminase